MVAIPDCVPGRSPLGPGQGDRGLAPLPLPAGPRCARRERAPRRPVRDAGLHVLMVPASVRTSLTPFRRQTKWAAKARKGSEDGPCCRHKHEAGGSTVGLVFSDRQRSDPRPRAGESQYAFLDRIAGPFWDRIRQLIDAWADGYSPADQTDVVRRLQSADDLQFLGAYWELLLFHGLKAMGFQVSCHPEVADVSTRPDFLVQGDQCSTYVEAKVLGDGRATRQQDKRRDDVEHGLNSRVRSDEIMVQLLFKKEGARPIPISK